MTNIIERLMRLTQGNTSETPHKQPHRSPRRSPQGTGRLSYCRRCALNVQGIGKKSNLCPNCNKFTTSKIPALQTDNVQPKEANMMYGYCSSCDMMTEGNDRGACPKCGRFLSPNEPKRKETTPNFTKPITASLNPEEQMRMQRLINAGYIKDGNDVMRRGLLDMESAYGTGHNKSPDSVDQTFADIENAMAKKIKLQQLKDLNFGGQQQGSHDQRDSDRLNMRDMFEIMMMKGMMDMGKGGDSHTAALQQQIQMLQQQMLLKDQDAKFQSLLAEINRKGTTDSEVAAQIRDLQREYQQNMEKLRDQAQGERERRYEETLNQLRTQIQNKSSVDQWNSQMQEIFTERAMKVLKEKFEQGLSGATPEKSGGQLALEIFSETAKQLGPAIQSWIEMKRDQQLQEPKIYTPKPQHIRGPSIIPANTQNMPPIADTKHPTESSNTDEGNAISRIRPPNDPFSQ